MAGCGRKIRYLIPFCFPENRVGKHMGSSAKQKIRLVAALADRRIRSELCHGRQAPGKSWPMSISRMSRVDARPPSCSRRMRRKGLNRETILIDQPDVVLGGRPHQLIGEKHPRDAVPRVVCRDRMIIGLPATIVHGAHQPPALDSERAEAAGGV